MKQPKNVKVVIDGDKRDIEYTKEGDNKNFKFDGPKLSVEVNKDEKDTTVDIKTESGFLKTVGKIISKIILRRFKK
jgi:hypothetical protein